MEWGFLMGDWRVSVSGGTVNKDTTVGSERTDDGEEDCSVFYRKKKKEKNYRTLSSTLDCKNLSVETKEMDGRGTRKNLQKNFNIKLRINTL